MIDLRNEEERDAAAGEYVLGTLDLEDHEQVRVQSGTDSALRARIYEWQDRLLPLSAEAAARVPQLRVWLGIASASAVPPSRSREVALIPWWRRLRLWQGVDRHREGDLRQPGTEGRG